MIIRNIDLPKEITEFLSSFKILSKKRLEQLIQFPFVKSISETYQLNIRDINWHLIHDIPFCEHICPICGKHLHVNSVLRFPQTCSASCSAKFSRPKLEKTCLEKYGIINTSSLPSVKYKKEQTCLSKYGVTNPIHSVSIKEKIKQTNLVRYGVKCSSQNQDVKDQIAKTLKDKTGFTYPFLNPECLNKAQYNRIKSRLHSSFVRLVNTAKDLNIEPLFTEEAFVGSNYIKLYRWKCLKCGTEFDHWFNSAKVPTCPNCRPKYHSSFEQEIFNFVKDNISEDIEIQHNVRSIINPFELDIYIPALHLAIEFNGDYWHSEDTGTSRNYHLNKTKLCEEKGIHLVHIFEHQWLKNQDQVKSRLCSLLDSFDNKIFARKCVIREIDSKTTSSFLNQNHLQGYCPSKINLGLFYLDELVSIMTFGKPRFNKEHQWELLRFCSTSKYKVIGGAGKLLKYFEKVYKPNSLISYANRCWSSKLSNVYEKIGFKLIGESEPSYIWVKDSSYFYSRYQCQKHKLKSLLGEDNFDPNLSESENMQNNRFHKIYDCGNLVFSKIYD